LQPGQNQSVVVNNKVDSKTVQEAVDEAKKKSLVLSGEVAPNNSSKVKIDPSKGEVKEVFVKKPPSLTTTRYYSALESAVSVSSSLSTGI